MPVAVPQIQDAEELNASALIIQWLPVPDDRENMKGRVRGYTVIVYCFDKNISSKIAFYSNELRELDTLGRFSTQEITFATSCLP